MAGDGCGFGVGADSFGLGQETGCGGTLLEAARIGKGTWKMDSRDFDFKRIAQGYKNRPFLHKQVMERFGKEVTGRTFSHGLDVGCGAGLSSKALKRICTHVTGADISPEMVRVAKEVCGDGQEYDFMVSRAEEIPAVGGKYDIVTAAGVIQWVDREPFLRNLANIMEERGYVLIYDFAISGQMKGTEGKAYAAWWEERYLKEFPKPYRNEYVWTKEDVEPYGFSMLGQVWYGMEYEFDMDSFMDFMMIQSNVNAKIEKGVRGAGEVREWFARTLEPVFCSPAGSEKRTLVFTGYSWYMAFGGHGQ